MREPSSDEPGGSSHEGAAPAPLLSWVPEFAIAAIQHGTFQEASRLNPRFAPDRPLLLTTLDIVWTPADPLEAIAGLEERLLAFSPGFRKHECRGLEAYHVFPGPKAAAHDKPSPKGPRRASSPREAPYDANLALAHLVEHAIIDFQCEVTGESTCSGMTGAYRSVEHRYDLMVECGDFELGCCCLGLALSWMHEALQGHFLGVEHKDVLAALGWVRRHGSRAVFSSRLAMARGWTEERAERALTAIRDTGYLEIIPYSVSISGLREYRQAGHLTPPLPGAGHAKDAKP
jgi:hypothetical protein